jgi:hypothetical protein
VSIISYACVQHICNNLLALLNHMYVEQMPALFIEPRSIYEPLPLGGETPSRISAWSLIRNENANCSLWESLPWDWEVRGHCMCKEMLVIPVNTSRLGGGPKKNNRKKCRAKEERHKGSLTPPPTHTQKKNYEQWTMFWQEYISIFLRTKDHYYWFFALAQKPLKKY